VQKNPTLLFVVAAALVDQSGRILLQKRPLGRPMAGLWEFPGGKLEDGEMPRSALIRELREELGLIVEADDLIPACFANEALGDKDLLLLLYICTRCSGVPHPHDGQEWGWFALEVMADLPMPPADIPLVQLLKKLL
jgi:8-oxo-dGTP diphosphatase